MAKSDFDKELNVLRGGILNEFEIDQLLSGPGLITPEQIKHMGDSETTEKSIVAVINVALSLLIEAVHIIKDINNDVSMCDTSMDYDKSFLAECNLYELGEIELFNSLIERLRNNLSSWYLGSNRHSEEYRISSLNELIVIHETRVSILERIVKSFLDYDDRFKNINLAIISAYRSCRESHIIVNSMIEAYNSAVQKEFDSKAEETKTKNTKYLDPITKIIPLVVPKENQQSG